MKPRDGIEPGSTAKEEREKREVRRDSFWKNGGEKKQKDFFF